MQLDIAPEAYSKGDQNRMRETLKREAGQTLKRGQDNIIPNNERLVLTSPNGTKYAFAVSNAGVLSMVAYP